MTEPILLEKAQILAKRILRHHEEILKLRKQILPSMRKVLLDNRPLLETCVNRKVVWMLDKTIRGYFGCDVKSNQLLRLIIELRTEVDN